MPDKPTRPPRREPLRADANVPATTLEELNARIDQVVQNGRQAIGVLQDVSETNAAKTDSNSRLLRWVIVVAAVAVVASGLAIRASSDAANAQSDICHATQQNRDLLKAVVVASYNGSGSGQLNLKAFPHYAQLDAATKGWVDDLQAAISPGSQPNQTGDRDGNKVPDGIDAILNAEVCATKSKTPNRTIPIAAGGTLILVTGYGLWERRRHRQPHGEATT